MANTLASLMILLVLGLGIGFAYTNGACLTLNMGRFIRRFMLCLLIAAGIGLYLNWMQVTCASVVTLGICLAVQMRLLWLLLNLPWHLQRRPMAARPDEETPAAGKIDGHWALCYESGQHMCYDERGKLCRIGFPDGTHWDLSNDK